MHQKTTIAFFSEHPVFSLSEAEQALGLQGERQAAVGRLKHHLSTGRLKLVAREIYAVVPHGAAAESFTPDPFLVAAAARPNAIFSHHSALELLGAAHSAWSECTVFAKQPRAKIVTKAWTVRFLATPPAFKVNGDPEFGTRKVARRAQLLRTTGPERTLVEGFKQPRLVGGVAELTTSASGFVSLDLDLLCAVLEKYNLRRLWAAVGWFLESNGERMGVAPSQLDRFEARRPRSPTYLVPQSRGGTFVPRWNLMLPPELRTEAADAGES